MFRKWIAHCAAGALSAAVVASVVGFGALAHVGLPHGDSGRFLAEQASCLADMKRNIFDEQRKRFESCAQGLIWKYVHVWVPYEEYAGNDDGMPKPPSSRFNWPAFPLFRK